MDLVSRTWLGLQKITGDCPGNEPNQASAEPLPNGFPQVPLLILRQIHRERDFAGDEQIGLPGDRDNTTGRFETFTQMVELVK
jgi:hypothetical protein